MPRLIRKERAGDLVRRPLPVVRRARALGACLAALLLALAPWARSQADPTYADVAAILATKCVMCHSGQTPAAGLRLDSLEAVLEGGAKGPVVKSGAPAESELVRRIKGISQPRMPMTGPPYLSDAEIAALERWVAGGLPAGAPLPQTVTAPRRPKPGEQVTYLHVAPIFAARCAKCHADNGLMGAPPEGFRLTSYESTLATSDRARVVPRHPGASELLRRIRGQARPRMPLDGPPYLDRDDTQLIEDWIAQGARNAQGAAAPVPAGAAVRLHGTLDPGGRLDGLDLLLGQRTRVDRRPAPGAYVQVRGRLDPAGRVVVERLRPR
jgi:mono/diheme cytochrome c family protein